MAYMNGPSFCVRKFCYGQILDIFKPNCIVINSVKGHRD